MKREEGQSHLPEVRSVKSNKNTRLEYIFFLRCVKKKKKKEDWNKPLEMWSRGNPEESIMVEERESQQHTKLAHSIEEILRRPTCVEKDTRVFRNWSVIKESSRTSTGIFLFF